MGSIDIEEVSTEEDTKFNHFLDPGAFLSVGHAHLAWPSEKGGGAERWRRTSHPCTAASPLCCVFSVQNPGCEPDAFI